MKKFKNAAEAYAARPGRGEILLVAGREFRVTEGGLLKSCSSNYGMANVSHIVEKFNRTGDGGWVRERVKK